MKICVIADAIPPEVKGGAALIAWQSALGYARAGHEVSFVTTTRMDTPAHEIIEGVSFYRIKASHYHERWRAWRSLYNPRVVAEAGKLFEEIRPDVIHAHNVHYYLSYAVLKAARKSGAKVFLTTHDVGLFHYGKLVGFADPHNPVCKSVWDYRVSAWRQFKENRFRYNPFRNLFIRRSLRNLAGLVAVSHALSDAFAQNGIAGAEVIHNGINTSEWTGTGGDHFREQYGFSKRPLILFAGRVNGAKGGGVILDILDDVIKEVPNVLLVVAANKDSYAAEMLARAQERSLAASIVWTGWLESEDMRAAYAAANVVVIPSVCFDSLPTVGLEAMASSKPVVGSCFGGIPELIADSGTGFLANPFNTHAFAQGIVRILKHPDRAAAMGAAGRRRVEEEFSQSTQTLEYLRLFNA